MIFAVFVMCAYLLGSIPFGLLVTKAVKGIDIRTEGSQNIGATNVFRVVGKKWGIGVFVLDALKGYAAVTLPALVGHSYDAPWNLLLAMFSVLGHSFPIWLKFKGGKGVATSFGVFLGVASLPCILTFAVFCLVFACFRILSLASLAGALIFPLMIAFFYVSRPGYRWYIAASLALTGFIFYTHRLNIKRLLKGEEKKLI